MIIDLLIKDFKEEKEEESTLSRILKCSLNLIIYFLVIALETFIFISIDVKLNDFSQGSTYDFLIVFLGIILIFTIIFSLGKARLSLFKEKDIYLLAMRPILKDDIIISKYFFVYLNEVKTIFLLSIPILIGYGITREYQFSYYVLAFLYPFLISLFTSGITFIFVIPYKFLHSFLKKHLIVQFFFASILMISLCFLYQLVLNLFLNILNNTQIDALFNETFIQSIKSISKYAFPLSNYLSIIILKDNIVSSLFIFLGILLLSLGISFLILIFTYKLYLNDNNENKPLSKKNKPLKIDSVTKTLINKELILVFRNSNFLFSYTALLIMEPFFAYVVVSSLNSLLFVNLEMLLTYFPELINGINLTLILLFSSLIASQTMEGLKNEGKGLINIKTIPVSPLKQSLIKILIPSLISITANFITLIVLISSYQITLTVFLISLLLSTIFTLSLNIIGLYANLRSLSKENSQNNISLPSTLGLLLPITLAIIHFLMAFLKVNSAIIYLTESLLFIFIFVMLIIPFKKIVSKRFLEIGGQLV